MDRSTINNTNNTQNITNNNYHFPNIFSIGRENVVETLSLFEHSIIDGR